MIGYVRLGYIEGSGLKASSSTSMQLNITLSSLISQYVRVCVSITTNAELLGRSVESIQIQQK